MIEPNEQVAFIISQWKKNHILAFEQLFGVELDEQQRGMIEACQDDRARVAVKSGTGCGKTFCLAGLTYLYLLLFDDVRIFATSPSYSQLSRVYRTELDKLYGMMLPEFKEFFKGTMLKEKIFIEGMDKPRVCDLVTANPGNLESLQGGHSEHYFILMDEASAVEDEVYKTLIRTLTTPKTKLICTSNPTRNAGFYYDIFKKELENWDRITFNGFDSAHVSQAFIDEMASTFGEDSDTYNIGVLGEFGRIGESSFFPAHLVEQAFEKKVHVSEYQHYPKVVGVDVAGSGADSTVFLTRQGPFVTDITKHKGLDPMEVVAALVEYRNRIQPHQIYIDATGLGAGCGPRARELGVPVQDVLVVSRSPNPAGYFNLRAWLYGEVRQWLATGGGLPYDQELRDGMLNTIYTYSGKLAVQIVPKHIMRSKGYSSPDELDALSLTFMDNIYNQAIQRVKAREVVAPNTFWV